MTHQITSLQNPRIKQAVRLRDRRGRDDQRRILIDGVREIVRAWEAGVQLNELFHCPERCHPAAAAWLAEQQSRLPQVCEVSPAVFEKLAFGDRAEGLIAVAVPPAADLDRIPVSEGVVAVVEGIEKPGNVGAMLSTADAAGVLGMICTTPIRSGPAWAPCSRCPSLRLPVTRRWTGSAGTRIASWPLAWTVLSLTPARIIAGGVPSCWAAKRRG
jgi:tRNA G18 (ribose-2'-O)-methylase SpoU